LRMDGAQFDALLQMTDGLIRKQDAEWEWWSPLSQS
jgi:hypothetical protein